MNDFLLELWDDQREKCTFYTVRWEGAKETEVDKFFKKYDSKFEFRQHTQELLSFVLDSIGLDHGITDALFRNCVQEETNTAINSNFAMGEIVFVYPNSLLCLYALKPKNRTDFVVLFNGGVKPLVQTNAGINPDVKWKEACAFATKIMEALQSESIVITGASIRAANGDNKIALKLES